MQHHVCRDSQCNVNSHGGKSRELYKTANTISIKTDVEILKRLMFQMSVWTMWTSCPPGIWTLCSVFQCQEAAGWHIIHLKLVHPNPALRAQRPVWTRRHKAKLSKLAQVFSCSYLLIQWKFRTAGKSSLGPLWRADTERTCSSFDVDGTQALAWRQSEYWPEHRH